MLKARAILATFFVLGTAAEAAMGTVVDELLDGHQVGNHCYRHDPPWQDRQGALFLEGLEHTDRLILQARAEAKRRTDEAIPVRLPYGRHGANDWRVDLVRSTGRDPLEWDVAPGDWAMQRTGDGERMAMHMMRIVEQRQRAGEVRTVILMHDASAEHPMERREETVVAVEMFAREALDHHGWSFVTL